MTIFSITPDNNITAHVTAAEANRTSGGEQFSSAKELANIAAKWPGPRLLEIWNSLPGQKPVKKFTDRKAGVGRIWTAIQNLTPEVATDAARLAPKTATSGKRASESAKPATAREGSKTAQVVEMLKRPDGATLNEIMSATGWQPHSVRGFISGALGKKMRLTVHSTKRADGQRVYSTTQ